MTSGQVMTARNLLGWSRERLGAMSGISVGTITSYERYGRLTRCSNGIIGSDQLAAIRAAFESAGIVFIEENGGGPGVLLQASNVTTQATQVACVEAVSATLVQSSMALAQLSATLAQLKAARKLLGWGVQRLAGRSGTACHLIYTYERSGRIAATYSRMAPVDPLAAIRAVLEEAGVEFVEDSEAGPSVRMRHPQENA